MSTTLSANQGVLHPSIDEGGHVMKSPPPMKQARSGPMADRVFGWLAKGAALFTLFRPQLERLLAERDRRVAAALATRPNLFEDRRTSLLSQCRLDVSRQFAWLESIQPGVPR